MNSLQIYYYLLGLQLLLAYISNFNIAITFNFIVFATKLFSFIYPNIILINTENNFSALHVNFITKPKD